MPDAYVFVVVAAILVAAATMVAGASPLVTAGAFGDGFWSLIPFTMQMAFVVIGGYVVASSPPVARLLDRLALIPQTGRGAICFVAVASMLTSLVHWGLSAILSGVLVRALARRKDLRMDYRAAGAAAYLGLGSVWALGLSSSAAQLQANPASMPASLLAITGVIPFSETIFLWQSMLLAALLIGLTLWIAWLTAPGDARIQTAQELEVETTDPRPTDDRPTRPGEWLEFSPLLNLLIAALGFGWLIREFANKGAITAISSLNAFNLLFLMLGLVLCWRPRTYLNIVARAVPGVGGILIQFPLYGGIAAMLTSAPGSDGASIAHHLAEMFASLASRESFPVLLGVYSAALGFFVPSAGGKWLMEAPYVMRAAIDLKSHLGWAVQTYNAAEALPNLISPFWMLPLLGVLRLKARDIMGYMIVQFGVHLPVVLLLLWLLGMTLQYRPPIAP